MIVGGGGGGDGRVVGCGLCNVDVDVGCRKLDVWRWVGLGYECNDFLSYIFALQSGASLFSQQLLRHSHPLHKMKVSTGTSLQLPKLAHLWQVLAIHTLLSKGSFKNKSPSRVESGKEGPGRLLRG